MATKKTKSTSTTSTDNPRLELAKALNQFATKVDALEKAYEGIKTVTKDTLTEFDLEIEAKKQELDRLEEQDSHDRKRRKTEADLEIAEHRYNSAVKILEERNEVSIPSTVLEEMKQRLQTLTSQRESEMEKLATAEKAKAKKALDAAISNCQLKQKAETAVLEATNQTQLKEIESLKGQIESLKNEVAEQRNLTARVAESTRNISVQPGYNNGK
uniref:Uncharacterized protein n=1 Tax=viral metagenome TaxID=1070528 RepID=A0A6C0BPH2_9ZZZZ